MDAFPGPVLQSSQLGRLLPPASPHRQGEAPWGAEAERGSQVFLGVRAVCLERVLAITSRYNTTQWPPL